MKKYLFVLIYLMIFVSQIFAQEQKLRPTLTVKGSLTDSIVVIHYSLPDSSYLEIIIFDRTGRGPVAVPVYQFQKLVITMSLWIKAIFQAASSYNIASNKSFKRGHSLKSILPFTKRTKADP